MGGPRGAFKDRPKKKAADRKKRVTSQRKRLLASGLDETAVNNMTVKEVRDEIKVVAKK